MKKRILTTLLTVMLLTAAFSATALAWDGWADNGGNWSYYQNDQPVTGWLSLNGTWYYMDNTGIMTTSWQNVNGTWYYMNDTGAMTTGWQNVNGTWYYMDDSGAMTTGWQLVNGSWYYMYDSGAMTTGWQLVNGTWYYMYDSGAMATGWLSVVLEEHYLEGTDIIITDSDLYYLDDSGAMVTGWLYKEPSKEEPWLSGWYYMDDSGRAYQGWLQSGGAWYFIAKERGMLANTWYSEPKNTMQASPEFIYYFLKSDGTMACNETLNVFGETCTFDASGAAIGIPNIFKVRINQVAAVCISMAEDENDLSTYVEEMICRLPNVDQTLGMNIARYLIANGKLTDVGQLLNVEGMTQDIFNGLKDYVILD